MLYKSRCTLLQFIDQRWRRKRAQTRVIAGGAARGAWSLQQRVDSGLEPFSAGTRLWSVSFVGSLQACARRLSIAMLWSREYRST